MIRRHKLLATLSVSLFLSIVALACSGDTETASPPEAQQLAQAASESSPTATASPRATVVIPTPGEAQGAPIFSPTNSGTARIGNEPVAPELVGLEGWANSEPFTMESQRGKVVLYR